MAEKMDPELIELGTKLDNLRHDMTVKSTCLNGCISDVDQTIRTKVDEVRAESKAERAVLEHELERIQKALQEKDNALQERILALEQEAITEREKLKQMIIQESKDCQTQALQLIDEQSARINTELMMKRKRMSEMLLGPKQDSSTANILREMQDMQACMEAFQKDFSVHEMKLQALMGLASTWQQPVWDAFPSMTTSARTSVDYTPKSSPNELVSPRSDGKPEPLSEMLDSDSAAPSPLRPTQLSSGQRKKTNQTETPAPKRPKSSKYEGVSKRGGNRYEVNVKVNGKCVYVGSFNDETTAGRAYDNKRRELGLSPRNFR